MSLNDQRPALWILLCAILAMIGAQVFVWNHVTDDAYIGFRYVSRLVEGHGLTFNPGERVEGFSNPLWVLLLALVGAATPFSLVDAARCLGFAAAVVTLLALFRISCITNRGSEFVAFGYAALILLATPGFHVYATAGLETALLGMLVAVGALLSLGTSSTQRVLAGLCFGLAAITRPETPLYALLWWLFTGGPRRLLTDGRREWAVVIVLSLPFVAYELFRISYFGEVVANTFVAKPPGTFGGLFGVPYLSQWAIALGGPLLLVVWLLRRQVYDPAFKQLVRVCAGPILAASLFMVYAMSDWMPFGRFMVPVAPLLAACVGAALARWTTELVNDAGRPIYVVMALVASALLANSFAAWNNELKAYVKNEGNHHVMRGTDQVAVGKWLDAHIKPGTTLATKRLGGISFGAPSLIVWDLLGLTDREQARFIRSGGKFGGGLSPVEARMPTVIAATDIPGFGYKTETGTIPWLEKNYELVTSLPQGNFGYIDVWVARNKIQEVVVPPASSLKPAL